MQEADVRRMLQEELGKFAETLIDSLAKMHYEQMVYTITDAGHGAEFKQGSRPGPQGDANLGHVLVRLYDHKNRTNQPMTFFMAPVEAHKASFMIDAVLKQSSAGHADSRAVTHDYKGIKTTLSFASTGAGAYSISLSRRNPDNSEQKVMSVKAKAEDMSFLSSYLRSLAFRQSYARPAKAKSSSAPATDGKVIEMKNPFAGKGGSSAPSGKCSGRM